MLRIAHLTNTFRSDATGITNVVADLAVTQARRGDRVSVLCRESDESLRELTREHGIDLYEGVDGTTPATLWRAARTAAPLLRQADVIHCHTVRACLVAAIATPIGYAGRSVSTLHNPYQRSVPLMYTARTIVSISAVDQKYVTNRTLRLRKPAMVLNGTLQTPRLPPLESLAPEALGEHAVVYVGALTHRKGIDVLLHAMNQVLETVPDAHAYLIGNRDNPELESLSGELGLSKAVSFLGFRADPRPWMLGARVVVLPARAEGFGLVITEARACGAPVVASEVGGIPEALDGGAAGLLVPPDDPAALADALVRVLSDDELRAELRRASAAGLERATVERMADDYDAVYAQLAGSRS